MDCSGCNGACCRLSPCVRLEDTDTHVPEHLTEIVSVDVLEDRFVWPFGEAVAEGFRQAGYTEVKLMRIGEDGLCIGLDRKTGLCQVYADRPSICHKLEPGSEECQMFKFVYEAQQNNLGQLCS